MTVSAMGKDALLGLRNPMWHPRPGNNAVSGGMRALTRWHDPHCLGVSYATPGAAVCKGFVVMLRRIHFCQVAGNLLI